MIRHAVLLPFGCLCHSPALKRLGVSCFLGEFRSWLSNKSESFFSHLLGSAKALCLHDSTPHGVAGPKALQLAGSQMWVLPGSVLRIRRTWTRGAWNGYREVTVGWLEAPSADWECEIFGDICHKCPKGGVVGSGNKKMERICDFHLFIYRKKELLITSYVPLWSNSVLNVCCTQTVFEQNCVKSNTCTNYVKWH